MPNVALKASVGINLIKAKWHSNEKAGFITNKALPKNRIFSGSAFKATFFVRRQLSVHTHLL